MFPGGGLGGGSRSLSACFLIYGLYLARHSSATPLSISRLSALARQLVSAHVTSSESRTCVARMYICTYVYTTLATSPNPRCMRQGGREMNLSAVLASPFVLSRRVCACSQLSSPIYNLNYLCRSTLVTTIRFYNRPNTHTFIIRDRSNDRNNQGNSVNRDDNI